MTDYNGSLELDKQTQSANVTAKKDKRKKRGLTKAQVLTRFTSCGRCSLFLTAYRIESEEEALDAAVANSEGNWLALPWNENSKRLLVKSFGCHLETDLYFFESSCPECLGKYRFSLSENETPSYLYFKI